MIPLLHRSHLFCVPIDICGYCNRYEERFAVHQNFGVAKV